MAPERDAQVVVVGGGPAGAAVATRLALVGHEVVLLERLPRPRWRACGVYTSPRTRGALAELGVSRGDLAELIRPIATMVVETTRGTRCLLDYTADGGACGIDRVRLERMLLDTAVRAGVDVREGTPVVHIEPAAGVGGRSVVIASPPSGAERLRPRFVVGADGPHSIVARSFGVRQAVRHLRRVGLTGHRSDPDALPPGLPMEARMVIGRGWYCGVAPVPGARVNVGLVTSEAEFRRALAGGRRPAGIVNDAIDRLPEPRRRWQDAAPTDAVAAALPLAVRVSRRAGRGFLLVGDAAGFLDPLTGEGLHRAMVTAAWGAIAVGEALRGRQGSAERYERRVRRAFGRKDTLSWLLQAFLSRPEVLDYALRRLAVREGLRWSFGRALADLEPAGAVLDPRYLVRLLLP